MKHNASAVSKIILESFWKPVANTGEPGSYHYYMQFSGVASLGLVLGIGGADLFYLPVAEPAKAPKSCQST